MRIFIDQVIYTQRNKGNISLLQVAVDRLAELWPKASIEVLTEAPYSLKLYCPSVHPVSVFPFHNWSSGRQKKIFLHQRLPLPFIRALLELRDEAKQNPAALALLVFRKKLSKSPQSLPASPDEAAGPDDQQDGPAEASLDLDQALENADLVVASGGGYMVDTDSASALVFLERLERAIQLNKPTVMVGQGVGLIKNPQFVEKAKSVLPRVDLIFIRDKRIGPGTLTALGVSPDRIVMTGDDAVEMAYNERRSALGRAIGVNLRVARYTNTRIVDHIALIRSVLHSAAEKYGTSLIGLPISYSPTEADSKYILELLAGYRRMSLSKRRYDQPVATIRKVGQCRVVVTGAYHPAIFALSQGIPAVCVAKSQEYLDKFLGLADDFGPACQIVDLNDPAVEGRLAQAIEWGWENAPQIRAHLLEVAECQIAAGKAAYHRIYDLVNTRNAARS